MKPNKTQLLRSLFARPRDSHKYNYGRVLVIGGSKAMAGAPVLAAQAALRSGAGVVEVCVPECVAAIVAGFDPCLITHSLRSDAYGCFAAESITDLYKLAERADVLVCGPGMGRSPELVAFVKKLWQDMPQTMIVDADALFALSEIEASDLKQHLGVRIITPHAGEMQRLIAEPIHFTKQETTDGRAQLEQAAQEFAHRNAAVVVLKGSNTLISDGAHNHRNDNGNPGMATAGSGDVLSGIIAALLGQGLPPFEGAQLAVWVHGMAGDLGAEALTELSVTANDIIDFIPNAWQKIQRDMPSE